MFHGHSDSMIEDHSTPGGCTDAQRVEEVALGADHDPVQNPDSHAEDFPSGHDQHEKTRTETLSKQSAQVHSNMLHSRVKI